MNPTQHTARSPIALVTGGSRGIGRSIALTLAERGVDIIFTYRSGQSDAEVVSAQIAALGRIAVALPLDLADTPSFEAFGASVSGTLEREWQRSHFDYLVNNAGVGMAATSFAATTEAQFDELLRVHLKGTFFLTQRLLPLVSDGGRVLNLSTGLARYTFPGFAAYAMMKGGVEVLTRYLASELGARGITVNSIAPGGVETDFGGGAMRDQQLQRHVAAQTALGRVAQPTDIGHLAAMVLAPESGWVTGQRIEATGGLHALTQARAQWAGRRSACAVSMGIRLPTTPSVGVASTRHTLSRRLSLDGARATPDRQDPWACPPRACLHEGGAADEWDLPTIQEERLCFLARAGPVA